MAFISFLFFMFFFLVLFSSDSNKFVITIICKKSQWFFNKVFLEIQCKNKNSILHQYLCMVGQCFRWRMMIQTRRRVWESDLHLTDKTHCLGWRGWWIGMLQWKWEEGDGSGERRGIIYITWPDCSLLDSAVYLVYFITILDFVRNK